jgi:PTS system nitrogen regulatory IIA component
MDRQKIKLSDHLDATRVLDLDCNTKNDCLAALVRAAGTSEAVADEKALLDAVLERESKLSTGIGLGIAVPHARIDALDRFVVVVGRHRKGMEFGSIDGRPVHIIVLIAGPQEAKTAYLELLAQLSKRLKLEDVRTQVTVARQRARRAGLAEDLGASAAALIKALTTIEDALIQSKSKSEQDPLNYPVRLNDKLAMLLNQGNHDPRPTQGQRDVFESLKERVQAQLDALQAILRTEVPAFNKAVADARVPAVILDQDR